MKHLIYFPDMCHICVDSTVAVTDIVQLLQKSVTESVLQNPLLFQVPVHDKQYIVTGTMAKKIILSLYHGGYAYHLVKEDYPVRVDYAYMLKRIGGTAELNVMITSGHGEEVYYGPLSEALKKLNTGEHAVNPNRENLKDMYCHHCGSYGPFKVTGTALFTLFDDGADEFDQLEIDDDESICICSECGEQGFVRDFKDAPATA